MIIRCPEKGRPGCRARQFFLSSEKSRTTGIGNSDGRTAEFYTYLGCGPRRPSAISCSLFSLLKTLPMPTEANFALSKLMSQPLKVAGFEMTLSGRFWLPPEDGAACLPGGHQ
jgi:hypothetical protein